MNASEILKYLVKGYQNTLSLVLPKSCRFHPSCSQYCLECLTLFSLPQSLFLTFKRLSKCHPFHPGGFDPPPSPYSLDPQDQNSELHIELNKKNKYNCSMEN